MANILKTIIENDKENFVVWKRWLIRFLTMRAKWLQCQTKN